MATVQETSPVEPFVDTEILYRCVNPEKPQRVIFYEPQGVRGTVCLSLNNEEWLLQPSQDGHHMFQLFTYSPNVDPPKDKGVVNALVQSETKVIGENEKDAIGVKVESEANPPAQLISMVFPKILTSGDYIIPPDPRFFYLRDGKERDGIVMESMEASGYCLAYDAQFSGPTTPALLQSENDPYWDNRFFYYAFAENPNEIFKDISHLFPWR